MAPFADLIRQGSAHAWLFIPTAVLLGALHGLEPGHSKTVMAAFIVAVRGTVAQAVLLGLAATLSHSIVVWGIALGGLYLWQGLDTQAVEPWLQMASAVAVIAIALWTAWRIRRDRRHGREHRHPRHHHGHGHHHHAAGAAAERMTGASAHELAHARGLERRFPGAGATSGQVVLFGLTGGLVPCPAAITVLLLCLQLERVALGGVLVLCFSAGLAVTLVAVGVAAALSVGHASRRWPWFDAAARRAPYLSSLLMMLAGLYMGIHGWTALA